MIGQKVRTLLDTEVKSGKVQVVWDSKDALGNGVSSGLYFYRLTVDGERWVKTRKMMLIK